MGTPEGFHPWTDEDRERFERMMKEESEARKRVASTEVLYFDKDGKPTDKDHAVSCVIHEYDANGTLLFSTHGTFEHSEESGKKPGGTRKTPAGTEGRGPAKKPKGSGIGKKVRAALFGSLGSLFFGDKDS